MFKKKSLPRGIVYHSVTQDLLDLIRAYCSTRYEKSIDDFEEKFSQYMGRKQCVAFPFARMAIYHSLKAAALPPKSKVIMPPITIKPILDVVISLGFTPVIVDIEIDTLCFNPAALRAAIDSDTAAVIFTYLFGVVPNMDELMPIVRAADLFVIEDFSHNFNAAWKHKKLGCFGDVGIYSASSIKTFDLHGSGILITDDHRLYEKLKEIQHAAPIPSRHQLGKKIITNLIRNLATSQPNFTLFTLPIIRLFSRLFKKNMIKYVGERNGTPLKNLPASWYDRFDPLQAEFGLRELPRVERADALRIANVNFLKAQFKRRGLDIKLPEDLEDSHCVFWQFMSFHDEPLKLQKYLHARGIDCATTSLSLLPALELYPCACEAPVARRVHEHGVFFPVYPSLGHQDLERVAMALKEFYDSSSRDGHD